MKKGLLSVTSTLFIIIGVICLVGSLAFVAMLGVNEQTIAVRNIFVVFALCAVWHLALGIVGRLTKNRGTFCAVLGTLTLLAAVVAAVAIVIDSLQTRQFDDNIYALALLAPSLALSALYTAGAIKINKINRGNA